MQPLYTYQRLTERESSSINGLWKGFHIALLLMAAGLGIMNTAFLHVLVHIFDKNCVFFPKSIVLKNSSMNTEIIYFDSHHRHSSIGIPIDFLKSQWVEMDSCMLSLYNPIMSTIFGLIWSVFFLMCSKGGRTVSGLKQPWRIVAPAFVFTFIYSIVCLVVSSNLSAGLTSFSSVLQNSTDTLSLENERGELFKINAFVASTITSSWLYTFCWVGSCILLVMRCILAVDFKVITVRVELIEVPYSEIKHKYKIDAKDEARTSGKSDLLLKKDIITVNLEYNENNPSKEIDDENQTKIKFDLPDSDQLKEEESCGCSNDERVTDNEDQIKTSDESPVIIHTEDIVSDNEKKKDDS